MAHRRLKGVTRPQLWNTQVFRIPVYNLWRNHCAQGKGALLCGNGPWLQKLINGKVIHDNIPGQCNTGVPGESGRNSSYHSRWSPIQCKRLERNTVSTRGAGTDLPPHNRTTAVPDSHVTPRHTYGGSVTHHTREEIRWVQLGGNKICVEVPQGNTESEAHLKR